MKKVAPFTGWGLIRADKPKLHLFGHLFVEKPDEECINDDETITRVVLITKARYKQLLKIERKTH